MNTKLSNPLRLLEFRKNYEEGKHLPKWVSDRLLKQRYVSKSYADKIFPDGTRKTVRSFFVNYRGQTAQKMHVLPGWESYTQQDFNNSLTVQNQKR